MFEIMNRIYLLLTLLLVVSPVYSFPDDYTWNTQSKNSSESMPCGGGDIGMNVWVENDELLFYISRSGTLDEHNTLLKQGRIRIRLDNANLVDKEFRQTLKLKDGYIEVLNKGVNIRIWADVFKPVIHVELDSESDFGYQLSYENWRYKDRPIRKGEGQQCSYKWTAKSYMKTTKDSIYVVGNKLLFFHKNPHETVFDTTVTQQGLDSVKSMMYNPLGNLMSGGMIISDNLEFEDVSSSVYQNTDYKSWNLKTKRKNNKHEVIIALHTEQTPDIKEWEKNLREVSSKVNSGTDRSRTLKWWNDFWERSFIESCSDEADMITRNYTLFRYMLGCNAYGSYPTKFNGGLFTFDPLLVDKKQAYTPDYRKWGGGTMTAQNQRLVYWGMLKSGDFDMMDSQFRFYNRILTNAELRSKVYWGHDGACYCEQIENFGLPNYAEYGTKRPEGYDKGMEYNAWLEYEWDTVLEFCQMILETNKYADKDIEKYIPMIESVLTFFDEHYRSLAAKRGTKQLDGNGKLIIYPGSGCETYKMAYNPASTVAALMTVTRSLIEYNQKTNNEDASRWTDFLGRIPAIPFRYAGDKKVISPAVVWERVNNVESPQLYPVFPWRVYGIFTENKEEFETAVNTYLYDSDALKFRSHVGWKQDNIWAACLGLRDEAVKLNVEKLKDGPHRFPAFWGPGFDWTPDLNHGGSGMIGLQEMLLQASDDKIFLLPSWNPEWDVHFKLHTYNGTVVELEYKNGVIEKLDVHPSERKNDLVICTGALR